MPDLKSTLARTCVRFPLHNSIQRWRVIRRVSRALRLHFTNQAADRQQPCHSECGLRGIGFAPYVEMTLWRFRFYAALAAFVLLLVGCLLGGTGACL